MNMQSSGEIDFSAPLLTMKNDAATGDDIFSFLLSELDIFHDSDYLGCLMRCLAVLLNFSSVSPFLQRRSLRRSELLRRSLDVSVDHREGDVVSPGRHADYPGRRGDYQHDRAEYEASSSM